MMIDEHCRFRPPESGRQLTWEITRFCNLFCDHCCTTSGPAADRNEEPPFSALLRTAEQLADQEVSKVQFSGGEPLLLDGIFDLLEAIDTNRVRIHVASNGYRLDEEAVSRLAKIGIHKLSVSVDGGAPAVHDRIRQRRGAFDRTIAGIERAVAGGIRVGVSVTVTPDNVGSLESLTLKMIDIGVTDASFHSVVAVGRAAEHPELMFPAENSEVLATEVTRLREQYEQALGFDDNSGGQGSRSVIGCPGISGLLHIDPSGDVSPCSWLYKLDRQAFSMGNIGHEDFGTIVAKHCARLGELRTIDPKSCIIPLVTSEPEA